MLKRMLVFSHRMVFIENEAAVLCITKWEHTRAFAAQSSIQLFDIAFAINVSFCGSLFKHILAWKQDISKR